MKQIIIEQNDQGQIQLKTNGPIQPVEVLGLLAVAGSLVTKSMTATVQETPSIVPASSDMLNSLKNRINGG